MPTVDVQKTEPRTCKDEIPFIIQRLRRRQLGQELRREEIALRVKKIKMEPYKDGKSHLELEEIENKANRCDEDLLTAYSANPNQMMLDLGQ